MEPQWNPSIQEQAVGRSYRLGQTEHVSIIEYIMKDTVEDVSLLPHSLHSASNRTMLIHILLPPKQSNVLPRQRTKIHLAGGGFGKGKRGAPPGRLQALLVSLLPNHGFRNW